MGLSWSGLVAKPAETDRVDLAPVNAAAPSAVARPGRLEAFEGAFASAGIGFWIYAPASGELLASAGLREILDAELDASGGLQQLKASLFGSEVDAERDAAWDAAWREGGLFDHEHRVGGDDDEHRWVRSLVSVSFGADGAPERVFGLALDIDQQKRREEAYLAAKDEAETASRRKSEFVATMSHEIRTPLNGVMGMAQILAATELDANQRACLDTIDSSGRALMTILNDSLDLSKIEAGLVELHADAFDLETLLRETVASASGVAVQQGVDVGHSIAPHCAGEQFGDADRLRQILSNLIFNGLKFTERGSVTVSVAPGADGMVRFEVRDTGPGIAEAELGRIFERFRQTRSEESGQKRGTGLGLAISKNLVEMMGGRIGVESLVNVGSTFWFELPLTPSAEAGAEDNPSADDETPQGVEEWIDDGAVRVLIAEDDPTNQKVFAMAFEPTGYVVEFANNGQEALDWLARARFDLVLMDINMPVMSGEEAIAQIRAAETPWRDVPIIVVTALTNRDSRRYYCSIGATDYLPKPLDIALLIKKTANLLGEAAARPALIGADS